MTIAAVPTPPAEIEVYRPHTVDELLALLKETEAPHYFAAGCTDLLVQHKDGVIPSSAWLDITALDELRGISVLDDQVRLGALTTHEEISRSPLAQKLAPALVAGCAVIGGPQIRWRGTLGGNIANASPAADTVPALYTLGAQVEILSAQGHRRQVSIDEFAFAPRKSVLKDGDLIVAVRFPNREGVRGTFLRLGQRQAQAISKVSVAITAVLDGSTFRYLRIACGSVAPTVIRAPRTEAILMEGGLEAAVVDRAAEVICEEVKPIDDIRSTREYRQTMAGVLLRRALVHISTGTGRG